MLTFFFFFSKRLPPELRGSSSSFCSPLPVSPLSVSSVSVGSSVGPVSCAALPGVKRGHIIICPQRKLCGCSVLVWLFFKTQNILCISIFPHGREYVYDQIEGKTDTTTAGYTELAGLLGGEVFDNNKYSWFGISFFFLFHFLSYSFLNVVVRGEDLRRKNYKSGRHCWRLFFFLS